MTPQTASSAQRSRLAIGYGLGALGSILFATKGIAIKLAYEEGVDTETLLALRMLLSLPFYVVVGVMALRGRQTGGAEPLGRNLIVKAGLVGILSYWFASYTDFLGLNYISAQLERLILFTYPLFTVLFGALLFRQHVRPRALFAFVFSYAGLALIFAGAPAGTGDSLLIGASLVIASAIAFALYQLLAKPMIGRIGPSLFTCIAMSAASIVVVAQFLLTHEVGALAVSPNAFACSLFLAIGATVIPSFLMNAALHRISAQANAVIGTLSPIATIVLAAAILGEVMTGTEWIGAVLIIAGVGWFTLMERR
ncbi:DMT family transporter [Emcibacter sp. SYSU 3D8]|uniref:DMT family transporter n=1 Tax=Emcibacter sp. SYSU 3D8 TaxID=3133969 RepID=UPI0031FEEE2E